MRPDASVPSFTPVPSKPKWKQASLWHPGRFLETYFLWKLEFRIVFPQEWACIWANVQTCNYCCMGKLSLFHLKMLSFVFDCSTTLWCQSFKASEVKHLKAMSNVKGLGPCRQLGAPVLQDISSSGTSAFWEQWVCTPEVGREKDHGSFSSDWQNSCFETNDLLYFKWQTHFFASTLALGSILGTLFSSNLKEPVGTLNVDLTFDFGKQNKSSRESNPLLLFDEKHVSVNA